jgi:hypothetical protein
MYISRSISLLLSAVVGANAVNIPSGDYDPMLKVKDFGGSLNKQSSVMYNVIAHVPSHQTLVYFSIQSIILYWFIPHLAGPRVVL